MFGEVLKVLFRLSKCSFFLEIPVVFSEIEGVVVISSKQKKKTATDILKCLQLTEKGTPPLQIFSNASKSICQETL